MMSMAWRVVAKLSLLCKSRNYIGLRGDWQLVTLTQLFLSSKKQKKDINEPLVLLTPSCDAAAVIYNVKALENVSIVFHNPFAKFSYTFKHFQKYAKPS